MRNNKIDRKKIYFGDTSSADLDNVRSNIGVGRFCISIVLRDEHDALCLIESRKYSFFSVD